MFRVMLRNAAGHKLRLMLTALAVILGVAFVSGTFILTDSIRSTFNSVFAESYKNVSVVVRGTEGQMQQPGAFSNRRTVNMDLVPTLQKVDGVRDVTPVVQGTAVLVGKDGTAVSSGGAPTFGFSTEAMHNGSIKLINGAMPTANDQVAVDKRTLEKSGLALGESTRVVAGQGVHPVTVVGETEFNGGTSAGATMVVFTPTASRQYFAADNTVPSIEITAAPGITQNQLRDRVAAQLPPETEAVTATQQAQDDQDSLSEAISAINIVLLIFAGLALFVGAFIIFNTFSMLVAQRTRELALLRAMGAKKSQVTRAILGEAVLVGIVGSTLGLGLGVLLAWLLKLLMSKIGLELSSSLPISLRTIIVTYSVGIVVTVLAALLPAWRAGQAPPVEAMRGELPVSKSRGVVFRILAAVAVASGAALIFWGLHSEGAAKGLLLAAGVVLVLLGVLGLTSLLVIPFSALFAWPYRVLFGPIGILARTNALRNSRRTAATAAALTIGVTAVCAVAVVADSSRATVEQATDNRVSSDFFLTSNNIPLPLGVAEQVRKVPGVESVWALAPTGVVVDGQTKGATAVTKPTDLSDNLQASMVSGSLDSLQQGQVVVSQGLAAEKGWQVGQTINASVGLSPPLPLTIGGIITQDKLFLPDFVLPYDLYARGTPSIYQFSFMDLVKASPGADLAQVREQIAAAVKPYAIVSVQDKQAYIDSLTAQVNNFLKVVYGLLAMAIIISVLGIINTLALSTFERTREIGLLRAIGMTRRQLRRIIRLESIFITLLGAVLGAILGVVLGFIGQEALKDQGISELSIPYLTLVVVIAVAALVGVLAAWWPSHRAARLNVLQAVTTE